MSVTPGVAVACEQDVLAGVIDRALVFVGKAHCRLVVSCTEPVPIEARRSVVCDTADEPRDESRPSA